MDGMPTIMSSLAARLFKRPIGDVLAINQQDVRRAPHFHRSTEVGSFGSTLVICPADHVKLLIQDMIM